MATRQPDFSGLYQEGRCIHDDEARANARYRGPVEDARPAAAAAREVEADLDDDLQDRASRHAESQRGQVRRIGEGAEERPGNGRQPGNRR